MESNIEKTIEIINKAIPYNTQITDYDFSRSGYIYFTWRSNRIKVTIDGLHVGTIHGQMEHGCDLSILLYKLLKIEYTNQLTCQ